jgi:ferredoxin
MTRFDELKKILSEYNCFKMICGAGNEDEEYVRRLSYIYTLAGAKILDVSANVDVVKAAKEGILLAYEYASKYPDDINEIGISPYIMVSVGMPGDHHVRKSYIDPLTCIGCGLCIPVCPTNAIPNNFIENLNTFRLLGGSYDIEDQSKEIVVKSLCIGCGKCSNICPKDNIISYKHNAKDLNIILPKCKEVGAELFELHAAVRDEDITTKEWELLVNINDNNYNSLCLDRLNLGNLNLEERISKLRKISKNKIMVQADGYPMSGGENDFNTTLQAVACADVINKKFNMMVNKKDPKKGPGKATVSSKRIYKKFDDELTIPILISGGTNALSRKLSNMVGTRINGVSIGTYARDIIEDLIQKDDFYNDDNIKHAYIIARQLVIDNLN